MERQRHAGTLVLDYGTGNLSSIKRALYRMGADCRISSSPDDVRAADRIILPGIGHFATAMANLSSLGLIGVLNEMILERKTPVLGICLGMEIMARFSEEGNVAGLGWIVAETVHFKVTDTRRHKVPHMGWNTIDLVRESKLMRGISPSAEFYFGHSYHLHEVDSAALLGETEYEYRFPAVVEKENIFGVQFHPEKSHDAGAQILKNFIEL